jgi:hypothetical protein
VRGKGYLRDPDAQKSQCKDEMMYLVLGIDSHHFSGPNAILGQLLGNPVCPVTHVAKRKPCSPKGDSVFISMFLRQHIDDVLK